MLDCSIVIPTYYPGSIIEDLFKSLPVVKEVFVLDNGEDKQLSEIIQKNYSYIRHIKLGDIGLGKTFNKSLEIVSSNNLFITQPDVILKKNCLENLLSAKYFYTEACILSPIYFDNKEYSKFDCLDLILDEKKKILNIKRNQNLKKIKPWGDYCAEAVASTSNLIDVKKLKSIGGWDDYFYTYLEDLDLSLRIRAKNYTIIKIANSEIVHKGFGSHSKVNHEKMNEKRIFNFAKSSLYFNFKHQNLIFSIFFFLKLLILSFFKYILYSIIFNYKKSKTNFLRLKAIYFFIKKN